MSTFKHGEFDITVNADGTFSAVRNGVTLTAGSLAGIKKKLDADGDFAPFKALANHYDGDLLRELSVVGVYKPRAGWRGPQWVMADGDKRDEVTEDTPRNRELLLALKIMRQKHHKLAEEMREAERLLAVQITRRKPVRS